MASLMSSKMHGATSCRPCKGGMKAQIVQRRAMVVPRAASADKPAVAQFADSIGLPTDEGLFGFKPFAEVWCGRLAMMGFVTSIVEEAMTGRGTLGQLGLPSGPNSATLGVLATATIAAVVVGSATTAYKLVAKKMTPKDIARYKNFLGLNNPDDWMAAAKEMKSKPDFTSAAWDTEAIAQTRAEGMAADRVFALNDKEQGEAAARELKAADTGILTLTKAEEAQQVAAAAADMKQRAAAAGPSVSLAAKADITEALFSANSEMAYARSVELSNGRAAMIGFLAAVLVEAASGQGILGQLIIWFKVSGLLGSESGF